MKYFKPSSCGVHCVQHIYLSETMRTTALRNQASNTMIRFPAHNKCAIYKRLVLMTCRGHCHRHIVHADISSNSGRQYGSLQLLRNLIFSNQQTPRVATIDAFLGPESCSTKIARVRHWSQIVGFYLIMVAVAIHAWCQIHSVNRWTRWSIMPHVTSRAWTGGS